MRTYSYPATCFVLLLVLCLMFAPSRRVTGDRMAVASSGGEVIPDLKVTPTKSFADLCKMDPVEAVAESLRAYKKLNLEGYTCTFIKQERIDGKLHPKETIACEFREVPFSVLMHWKEGKRRADATLYVAGDNDDRLLIIPATDFEKLAVKKIKGTRYTTRTLESSDAKSAARYPVSQFGIYKITLQFFSAWQLAADQQALQVKYRGIEAVPELKGLRCHVLERTCVQPEEGDITKTVAYFEVESKLQLGTLLYAGEELLAKYFYLNVQFNPAFEVNHFKAEKFE
jgi:hypothetical protein